MCVTYRHEIDDPSIKSKRDLYWAKIAKEFNDPAIHNDDFVDTGDDMVDSFCAPHCIPKFRAAMPVHKMFNNYTTLRTAYETSQEYKNWKASGQNDGLNFMEFQKHQPLHLMLHTFLHSLGKMQHDVTINITLNLTHYLFYI